MKHQLPSLDRFKVFESAARHLSFSRAAEELCITKGAVSYQIRLLEQQIDCQLFTRSVRQVYLTEAGQKLLRTTQQMFADLSAALKRISPASNYDISIAATTYVAARWLSPRVAKFLEKFPDTSIHFEHSINVENFRLENVDIALLWGRCPGHTTTTQYLELPMPLFPACSPLQAQRLQENPNAIKQVTLLHETRAQDLWLEWFGQANLENPKQEIEDANVRVQAAIDGQGLILADAMMKTELESGLLVRPFHRQLEGYGYSLISSPLQRNNAVVTAMIDWLISGVR